MFLFSIFINYNSKKGNIHINLAKEDKPSFRTLRYDPPRFEYHDHIGVERHISEVTESGSRKSYQFYSSTIFISDSTFKDCYGYGNGELYASGGALFVESSAMQITNTKFESNQAAFGGAVATVSSSTFIEKETQFQNNKAFRIGGAFYAEGNEYSDASDFKIYITGTTFTQNEAASIGGSIYSTMIGELYIDNSEFTQNSAGVSGGALYLLDTSAKIFDSTFKENKATDMTMSIINPTFTDKNINKQLFEDNPVKTKFSGRGGGAIFFIAFKDAKIYTQSNCFSKNKAVNGYNIDENGSTEYQGHEILIENQDANADVMWISMNDKILISDKTVQIYGKINKQIFNDVDFDDDSLTCSLNEDDYSTANNKFTFAETTNDIQVKTSNIPKPTTFIYEATPLTRLPYKTTSSYLTQYPSAHDITLSLSTRTVMATFQQTPDPPEIEDISTPHDESSSYASDLEIDSSSDETSSEESSSSEIFLDKSSSYDVSSDESSLLESSYDVSSEESSKFDDSTQSESSISIETIPDDSSSEESSAQDIEDTNNTHSAKSIAPEYIQDQTPETDDNSTDLGMIIGIVSGIIVFAIIIIILLWLLIFRRNKNDDSESSSIEMAEQTINETIHNIGVTFENPLFTSTIGETDDVFKSDFEEKLFVGFFEK